VLQPGVPVLPFHILPCSLCLCDTGWTVYEEKTDWILAPRKVSAGGSSDSARAVWADPG